MNRFLFSINIQNGIISAMKGGEPIFIDKNSKVGILMLHGFSSTPNEFKELSLYTYRVIFCIDLNIC